MKEVIVAAAQSIAAPGDVIRSVRDHARLATQAAEQGARLVLFPELSLTGYDRRLTLADAITASDPRLEPLQRLADAHDMIIVAGAPLAHAAQLHIGALCFVPRRGTTTYTKRFLHEGEEIAFSPGHGGEDLQIEGRSVGLAICAEITQPQHAREASERRVDIYAASCFITPTGYACDSGLLQGYAREHAMAVVMANYGAATGGWSSAGASAIWSKSGTQLALAPSEGEAVVAATVT